jgi:hypothetical protein
MNPGDLELLGYSAKWVESGFPTPELLRAQVEDFHVGDSKTTYGYRYAAFREILLRRTEFSDDEFQTYIELAESDTDALGIGLSALYGLMDHPGLTEAQREAMYAHPWIPPNAVKKRRLFRAMRTVPVSLETLLMCVEEGDSDIHRRLLELPDLPREVVEVLHERGGNRVVRNIAGVMLKRKYGHPRR